MSQPIDTTILEAALEGLEAQKRRIEERILQVRALIGEAPVPVGKPSRLSAAARKRIAAAQVKRWAAFRKGKAAE